MMNKHCRTCHHQGQSSSIFLNKAASWICIYTLIHNSLPPSHDWRTSILQLQQGRNCHEHANHSGTKPPHAFEPWQLGASLAGYRPLGGKLAVSQHRGALPRPQREQYWSRWAQLAYNHEADVQRERWWRSVYCHKDLVAYSSGALHAKHRAFRRLCL